MSKTIITADVLNNHRSRIDEMVKTIEALSIAVESLSEQNIVLVKICRSQDKIAMHSQARIKTLEAK